MKCFCAAITAATEKLLDLTIKNITIPNNIIEIGYNAFDGCSSLKYITIPENSINNFKNIFSNFPYITDIIIPNGIKRIPNNAFSGCLSLTNITIPDSVTEIGDSAFPNNCKVYKI